MTGKKLLYYLVFVFIALAISSCQRTSLPTEVSATQTVDVSINESVVEIEIEEPIVGTQQQTEEAESLVDSEAPSITDEPATQTSPDFTPTADLRLPPEQWREWPVISEISPNTISIYRKGISEGNDPNRFSKIGDCQMVKAVMGIYDLPARYTLTEENQYLQDTIDNFSGSFNRDGMAVKGGYNAATVLSPIWADPEICEPGETPIQCEFRVHNPSIVLISLEVWWDGRSPERYEQYMRRIIEYSIEEGVVPILSTKADNVEGDHSINLTTAKLAYEYDIPLWNFWRAVQDLPYQGIDPDRDGFHITVDAWNRRSFTALQSIHSVFSAANVMAEVPPDEEITPTEEASIEEYVSSLLFGTTEISPYDMDGTIYFEMTETIDGNILPAGIYSLVINQGDLVQIMPAGAKIISESLENGFITNYLDQYTYVDPGGKQVPLNGGSFTGKDVFMIAPNEYLTIEVEKQYPEVSFGIIDGDGAVSEAVFEVPGLDGVVSTILAATKDLMAVTVGKCELEECVFYTVENYFSPDKVRIVEMVPFTNATFQNSSGQMAFWRNIAGAEMLHLIDPKRLGNERYLGLYGNVFLDQAWKNDDSILAAIKMDRSDYYGRATEILHYIVDANTNVVQEYPSMNGLNPRITWSPDDQFLLTSLTRIDANGDSTIVLRILNMLSGQEAYLEDMQMSSETFIAIKKLIWLD